VVGGHPTQMAATNTRPFGRVPATQVHDLVLFGQPRLCAFPTALGGERSPAPTVGRRHLGGRRGSLYNAQELATRSVRNQRDRASSSNDNA